MAMEFKTVDVNNQDEQKTIEFWGKFAWTLKSSQRIFNKDSHLESRGDKLYDVTETTDYTKLVFERDKNMPEYQMISALENEYIEKDKKVRGRKYKDIHTYAESYSNDYRSTGAKILFIVIRVILVFIFVSSFSADFPAVGMILSGIGFILSFIISGKMKKSALEENISNPESSVCKSYNEFVSDSNRLIEIEQKLAILVK